MLAPESSECSVVVSITDANDNAPVFTLDVYSAVIPEDQAIGKQLLRVTANDDDLAENAKVTD